jgi:thymidylate kinase
MKRINERQMKPELYEKIEMLIQVSENFYHTFRLLSEKERILIVDGNQTVNEISEEIWNNVSELL